MAGAVAPRLEQGELETPVRRQAEPEHAVIADAATPHPVDPRTPVGGLEILEQSLDEILRGRRDDDRSRVAAAQRAKLDVVRGCRRHLRRQLAHLRGVEKGCGHHTLPAPGV